jgi:hypothetical protein
MVLLLSAATAWLALAVPFGLLLGRGIRTADHRDTALRLSTIVPDFIPDGVLAAVAAHEHSI